MKTKRQNNHKGWKQALSVLLVFALAAGLVLSMPALSGVAYAAPILWDDEDGEEVTTPETPARDALVNLGETCSVTVEFPKGMTGVTDDELTALEEKGVASDLYLIAPAVRHSGYDVYDYCVDSTMPYYELVKDYVTGNNKSDWKWEEPTTAVPEGYAEKAKGTQYFVFRYAPEKYMLADASEQEGLAELLAKIYFAPELLTEAQAEQLRKGEGEEESATALVDDKDQANLASTKAIGVAHENLPAGLYMNVVHGTVDTLQSWKNYTVLVESTNKVGTIAYSDTKVYTFLPQLISLPGLAGVDAEGNPQMDTTAGTAWAYNMTIDAKGEAKDRYADLEIEKSVDRLVNGGSATFVFHVAAYKPGEETGGTPVYETYVTLKADSSHPESLSSGPITNKIPVGSTVVITEEYGGAGYQFRGMNVSVSENDKYTGGDLPAITSEAGEKSIKITNIPAGSVHLTTPVGEQNILPDGTIETVAVTNTHDNTNNGGGAVVNSFTQGADNGWTWSQYSYNAETGEWDMTNTGTGTVPTTPTEEEG